MSARAVVLISKMDFESAEHALQIQSKTNSMITNTGSTSSKSENKKPEQEVNKNKNGSKINGKADIGNKKRCLVCRSGPSPSDKSHEEITKQRFELYRKLVKILDLKHQLPKTKHLEKKFRFCCQVCFQAFNKLWLFQQQLEDIRADMKEIVEKIEIAVKLKSPVCLDDSLNVSSLNKSVKGLQAKTKISQGIATKSPNLKSSIQKTSSMNNKRKRDGNISAAPEPKLPIEDIKIEPVIYIDLEEESDQELPSQFPYYDDNEEFQGEEIEITPNLETFRSRPQRENKTKAKSFVAKISKKEKTDNDHEEIIDESPTKETGKKMEDSQEIVDESSNDEFQGDESEINKPDSDKESLRSTLQRESKTKAKSCLTKITKIGKRDNEDYEEIIDDSTSSDVDDSDFNAPDGEEQKKKKVKRKRDLSSWQGSDVDYADSDESGDEVRKKKKVKRTLKPKVEQNADGRFPCDECEGTFANRLGFQRHKKEVHSNLIKRYKCPQCDYPFKRISDLNRHLQVVHLKKKPFKCRKCHKSFTSIHYRSQHEKIVCGNDLEARKERGKKFQAMKVKARSHGIQCPKCARCFMTKDKLERHIDAHHDPQKPPKERPKCDQCEMTFGDKTALGKHVRRMHEKIRDHKCPFCTHPFFAKREVDRHIQSIHPEYWEGEVKEVKKHIQCEECGGVYGTRRDLQRHKERVHLKLKKENCSICDLRFYSKSDKDRHVSRVHFKQRDHQCWKCGKQFSTSFSKHQHERLVCGDDQEGRMKRHQNYLKQRQKKAINGNKCQYCKIRFIKKQNLESHLKEVHPNASTSTDASACRFVCPDCPCAYSQKRSLQFHVRGVHLGKLKKRWNCPKCTRGFSKKTVRDKHLKNKHMESGGSSEEDEEIVVGEDGDVNVVASGSKSATKSEVIEKPEVVEESVVYNADVVDRNITPVSEDLAEEILKILES